MQAATQTENWCGVLQEVSLPDTNGNPAAFLAAAVDFANNRCWGTLSCAIMIPPDVRRKHPAAVDAAVAGLRYGSVCVNVATTFGFCVTKLPWGAFPGNKPQVCGASTCFSPGGFYMNKHPLHPQYYTRTSL